MLAALFTSRILEDLYPVALARLREHVLGGMFMGACSWGRVHRGMFMEACSWGRVHMGHVHGGVFMGRSLLGTVASRLLTVSGCGGLDE